MRKVYSLFSNSSIPSSALWLCLCLMTAPVWAGNSPFDGDDNPPCSASTTVSPASGSVCIDQGPSFGGPNTVMFTASPSGTAPFTHAWTIEDAAGTGATAANLLNANSATVTFQTTPGLGLGTITLKYTVTATGGCTSAKTVTVTTNPTPNAHVTTQWKCSTTSGGYTANYNLTAEVTPIINGGGAYTVYYYATHSDANNDVNRFSAGQAASYNAVGAHSFVYARIIAPSGCWLTGPVPLGIYPSVEASPSASSMTVCPDVEADLYGNPSGGSGVYVFHKWTHTGGSASGVNLSNSNSQNAHVSASGSGTIHLSYEVKDDKGCSDWETITITVSAGSSIAITALPDITVCPGQPTDAIELSALPLGYNFHYSWTGGMGAGLANGSASGADPEIPSFTTTTVEGDYYITITATRPGFCPGEETFKLTVKDVTPPVFIVCPTDMTVNNDVDKCGANVNWQAPNAVDNCGYPVNIYQVLPLDGKTTGSFFPIGLHHIKYTADDDYGNKSYCEFDIKVRDMQLPDIECPSGIQYLETNNGNCSHTLTGTYLNASVVENCGLDYVRNDYTNSGTLNGAVFPVGSWPIVVTWKAEDWSGNTATCSFAIIVVDNDEPTVASCPSDKTVSNDYGDCGAEVTYALPRFNDNCGGAYQPGTLIQGGASGDFFNVGTTVMEWWYFDPTGNDPAVCNFTITVRDDEDPKIKCPSNIVVEVDGSLSGGNGGAPAANPVLVSSGPCGVSLSYTSPVGTDNCAGVVTTLASGLGSGPNYYEYGGIYTESYNVVDNAGNSNWCSFTITVKDPVDPTITCPANTTVTTDVAECDAAVSYSFPYFGDNCPGYTLTQLVGSGERPGVPAGHHLGIVPRNGRRG
ncbi:MAG: HYR domain-containing protein [Lewinellaceae bacterium]|nr:HYR domain-containing protein [Lewinellaceae bacterium]